MHKPKLLSGEVIVAKSITKNDSTLPEIGLKDIAPNGSWLEQKQIQAALEARKHLIEIERIEKCGTLSHADWREDLMLAEVTQKTGGYWQYFGHNVGNKLFLKPEEALFLLEVNCLQLKHGDITVSLQKAYSLLLQGTISITQYKVYASLSRLGYKVFRHKEVSKNKPVNIANIKNKDDNVSESMTKSNYNEISGTANVQLIGINPEVQGVDENKKDKTNQPLIDSGDVLMEDVTNKNEKSENLETSNEMDVTSNSETNEKENHAPINDSSNYRENDNILTCYEEPSYLTKLKRLRNRQLKPTDTKLLHKYFENIPDLFQKQVFTINVPSEVYIPKNIFVHKSSYTLSLQNIRMRSIRPLSIESATYSVTDEVNGDHVRRIRSTSVAENLNSPFPGIRFPRQQFRPFNFWRPPNLNYYEFGMFFQRPYLPNMYFVPRYQFNSRPNLLPRQPVNLNYINFNSNNPRKRSRCSFRNSQLQNIKVLAAKLKHIIMSGNPQTQNIQALQRLVHTYNMKYRTRLRITGNFDVINDETIIDTIELDDEGFESKRIRLDKPDNTYQENLDALKKLALTLKGLNIKNKVTTRHRRVFSNAIKTFNSAYNSDVYLNSKYEVLDRKHITLDSSSESDCVVEKPIGLKKKKLLRNPFNVFKRLSEKMNVSNIPSTSKDGDQSVTNVPIQNMKYKDNITKIFNKNWLPSEDDFGRAEVISKPLIHNNLVDNCSEDFLYDFMNDNAKKYNSWLEAKKSFFEHIENTNIVLQQNQLQIDVQEEFNKELRPLISAHRLDMPSMLEKLRIISNKKDIDSETNLRIDFDVYNRDVQNFKKTSLPKPHFRIICIHESTRFPSAGEVSSLHAKYEDNIAIVFAVVGVSSVSYLQINPIDLPNYVQSNDLV